MANADLNVLVNSCISGIYTVNGMAGLTWVAANPCNTQIRMFYSQPIAPVVFLFNSPPAQFRVNQFLIDLGGLFARDADNLFGHELPMVERAKVGYRSGVPANERGGAQPDDIILGSQDVFDEDEDEDED